MDNSLQIMLIDSDKHIRESLSTFFQEGKDRFLIFKSASEGLNSLDFQNIDVVISDYFLPDMDGVAFLKKAAEKKPDIKRILMATIVSDDLEEEIVSEGIDALIEKPLNLTSLDNLILKLNKDQLTRIKPEIKNEK